MLCNRETEVKTPKSEVKPGEKKEIMETMDARLQQSNERMRRKERWRDGERGREYGKRRDWMDFLAYKRTHRLSVDRALWDEERRNRKSMTTGHSLSSSSLFLFLKKSPPDPVWDWFVSSWQGKEPRLRVSNSCKGIKNTIQGNPLSYHFILHNSVRNIYTTKHSIDNQR